MKSYISLWQQNLSLVLWISRTRSHWKMKSQFPFGSYGCSMATLALNIQPGGKAKRPRPLTRLEADWRKLRLLHCSVSYVCYILICFQVDFFKLIELNKWHHTSREVKAPEDSLRIYECKCRLSTRCAVLSGNKPKRHDTSGVSGANLS